MRSKALTLAFLSGVPFIMVLGNSMLIPVLPQMKEALATSQFKVSLAITLFSIPAGLTIPFAGFFSDRLNRKAIIAAALTIYGLGGVLAGLAFLFLKDNAYSIMMSGRILQGIGAAGTAPIAMALAGDIFTSSERSKVLGLLEASNGLGKVISPILGSLIGMLAWWAVFFVFPALCIPVALGILFLVQEPKSQKTPKPFGQYTKALGTIFKNKGVSLIAAFFAGSTVLFVLFGVLFYLSDHLETKYGIEGVLKGLLLAIPVLTMSLASYLTGIAAQKKQGVSKILVVLGLVLQGGALAVVPFFQNNTYVLVASLVLAGCGTGLVLPCLNTLITSSCNIDERGMVTALYGGVRFFGVAGGPPLFGFLMERSVLWTFLLPAVLALAVALFNFFFLRENVLTGQKQGAGGSQKGGILSRIAVKGQTVSSPALRPALQEDLQQQVVENTLKKLQPQIKKIVEKEMKREVAGLKEEMVKQAEAAVRESIKLEIVEEKGNEKS